MDRIITKTKDWTRAEGNRIDTGTGIFLTEKDQKDAAKYYGIPASLINIDKEHNTHTFCDVMRAVADEVEVMTLEVEDNKGSRTEQKVLDPKSIFMDDLQFDHVTELVQEAAGVDFESKSNGLSKVLEFTLPGIDSDNFLGDVYRRQLRIERLPQGGIALNTGTLRQICTNGAVVNDKQYTKVSRDGSVDHPAVAAFVDAAKNLRLSDYFETMFSKNGKPIEATVSDFLSMRSTLDSLSDGDQALVDTLFPMSVIEDFYAGQGIDFKTINRKLLERLPAGMTYAECWNILTNGAKHIPQTLENHIKIASYIRPSHMRQLNLVTPEFQGAPLWQGTYDIHRLMGDVAMEIPREPVQAIV